MEITLEQIELVKDRTGVTYKEAKEALEAKEGNVVDAIIEIEETVNKKKTSKVADKGDELVNKMKEIVNKGNISRIVIKKDEEIIMNLPLNAGLLGTLVAPWGVIVGVVAAFGFKCVIEFVKDDGSAIDLTEKAGKYYEVAKEKGTVVYEDLKEKGAEKYDEIKEKAPGVYEEFKNKAAEKFNKAADKASDVCEDAAEEIKEVVDDIKDELK